MLKIICDDNCQLYSKVTEAAFKQLGLGGDALVELVLTDGEDIRSINAEFRGIDKETDVLSFPSIDFSEGIERFNKKNYPLEYDDYNKAVTLGSIVINEAMAQRQADEFGHSFEREKAYLFLHGLLHIFGYDHIIESQKQIMRYLEESILDRIGLSVEVKGE